MTEERHPLRPGERELPEDRAGSRGAWSCSCLLLPLGAGTSANRVRPRRNWTPTRVVATICQDDRRDRRDRPETTSVIGRSIQRTGSPRTIKKRRNGNHSGQRPCQPSEEPGNRGRRRPGSRRSSFRARRCPQSGGRGELNARLGKFANRKLGRPACIVDKLLRVCQEDRQHARRGQFLLVRQDLLGEELPAAAPCFTQHAQAFRPFLDKHLGDVIAEDPDGAQPLGPQPPDHRLGIRPDSAWRGPGPSRPARRPAAFQPARAPRMFSAPVGRA